MEFICIFFLLLTIVTIQYSSTNCLSLILPSTENDFLKCYKQLFHYSSSLGKAKEVIFAISSVTNSTIISNILNRLTIKAKVIKGIRLGNYNAASNRNYGYTLSKCSIISFFDIDDVMSNNRISVLMEIFRADKSTEFILHRFTDNFTTLEKSKRSKKNILNNRYNLTFKYIYNSYMNVKERSNSKWCCKHIKEIKRQPIHNGWPSMRNYVMKRIKYNEIYNNGEDSDFNTRVIESGYNVTIMNLALGFYKKRNSCNYLLN